MTETQRDADAFDVEGDAATSNDDEPTPTFSDGIAQEITDDDVPLTREEEGMDR